MQLRFRSAWLFTGFCLIAFVIIQSLTSSPVSIGIHLWDKSLHTIGYFVLMGWFMQIYHTGQAKIFWTIFFVVMGVGLEFLQDLGGVRHYEVNDMIANCLGVFFALGLSYTIFSNLLGYIDQSIAKRFF